MSRQRRGFTLIELLIVIVILGILIGLGSGVARGLLDRGRLREAVNLVIYQVEEGRRLAKRLDQDVTVTVEQIGGSWSIDVGGRTTTLGTGVSISPPGATSFVFNAPFGTYAGEDVVLALALRDVTSTVTITGVMARTVVE